MKKVRVLIASIVCAVILMGVGYAAWTQSIHVKAFAKAGELKVRLANGSADGAWTITSEDNAAEWKISSNDGQTLTLSFDKLFPGAQATLSGNVVNYGNLPAKFSEFKVSDIKGYKSDEHQAYPDLFYYLEASIGEEGTPLPLNEFFNQDTLEIVFGSFEPNASVEVPPIHLSLSKDAPSSLQGKALEFSVEFIFEVDIPDAN
ncbi:MAG: hypothetical protein ACOX23_09415 [Peptococcia bacterium]